MSKDYGMPARTDTVGKSFALPKLNVPGFVVSPWEAFCGMDEGGLGGSRKEGKIVVGM